LQSPSSDNALQPLPRIGFSDLEPGQPNNYVPSSDCFTGATHYTEYIHLRECIERIKEAPSGTDPKKVDAVWDVYKKIRDVSLLLCKSLLRKSRKVPFNLLAYPNPVASECSASAVLFLPKEALPYIP
jgi:hypothetical protein